MTEHMIITDMTAIQMYGLIHLAIGIWGAVIVGIFYGYPHIRHNRERIVFWVGVAAVIILPAYFGLTAIAPGVPDFSATPELAGPATPDPQQPLTNQ